MVVPDRYEIILVKIYTKFPGTRRSIKVYQNWSGDALWRLLYTTMNAGKSSIYFDISGYISMALLYLPLRCAIDLIAPSLTNDDF